MSITLKNIHDKTEQIAREIHEKYTQRLPMDQWYENAETGLQSVTVVIDQDDNTIVVIKSGVNYLPAVFKTEVTLYNKVEQYEHYTDLMLVDGAFIDEVSVNLPLLEDHRQVMEAVAVDIQVQNAFKNVML